MKWFINREGEPPEGPYNLQKMATLSSFFEDTLVRREGDDEWIEAGEDPELEPLFESDLAWGKIRSQFRFRNAAVKAEATEADQSLSETSNKKSDSMNYQSYGAGSASDSNGEPKHSPSSDDDELTHVAAGSTEEKATNQNNSAQLGDDSMSKESPSSNVSSSDNQGNSFDEDEEIYHVSAAPSSEQSSDEDKETPTDENEESDIPDARDQNSKSTESVEYDESSEWDDDQKSDHENPGTEKLETQTEDNSIDEETDDGIPSSGESDTREATDGRPETKSDESDLKGDENDTETEEEVSSAQPPRTNGTPSDDTDTQQGPTYSRSGSDGVEQSYSEASSSEQEESHEETGRGQDNEISKDESADSESSEESFEESADDSDNMEQSQPEVDTETESNSTPNANTTIDESRDEVDTKGDRTGVTESDFDSDEESSRETTTDREQVTVFESDTNDSPEESDQTIKEDLGTEEVSYAGLWHRIFAFLADGLILGIVGLLAGLASFDYLAGLGPIGRLIGFAGAVTYFGVGNSWLTGGQTPGKYLFGIRVQSLTGDGLDLVHSTLRACVLGIPFFMFNLKLSTPAYTEFFFLPFQTVMILSVLGLGGGLLYMFMVNQDTRRSLHDYLASSVVLNQSESNKNLTNLSTMPEFHRWVLGCWLGALLIGATIMPYYLSQYSELEAANKIELSLIRSGSFHSVQIRPSMQGLMQLRNGDPVTQFHVDLWYKNKPENFQNKLQTLGNSIRESLPSQAQNSNIIMEGHYGFDLGISRFFQTRTLTSTSSDPSVTDRINPTDFENSLADSDL